MKKLIGFAFVLSLAAVGCGSSPCDNLKSASDSLETKAAPCKDDAGSSSMSSTPVNTNQCSTAITSCNDADKTALNNMASCFESVPSCDPNNRNAFISAILACAGNANLSKPCEDALNGSSSGTDAGM